MVSISERKNKKNSPSEKSYADLQHLPNFKKLSKGDDCFLRAFYPKRSICRSAQKLGTLFNVSRSNAQEKIDSWLTKGWIEKEHRYKKNKEGLETKVYKSNYYKVTKKGNKHLKETLEFLFETVKAKDSSAVDKIQKVFTCLHRYDKSYKNEPGESLQTSSSFSFEEKKVSLEKSSKISLISTPLLRISKKQLPKESLRGRNLYPLDLEDKDSFKKCHKFRAIQKMFKSYGYFQQLDIAHRGTLLILLTLRDKDIKKLLKLIRKKLSKGWKLRSFWGFFMSEVRKLPDKRRFGDPWFKMLSKEYRDAADGKKNRITEGADSNIIAEGITKLERETGEKAPEKTIERLLIHGIQKLKTSVDATCYRKGLEKGELPKEKALEDEPKPSPKGRPIFKQVKINTETKKPYTDEDFLADKPFSFTNKIVGYEQLEKQPQEKSKYKKELPKVRSWIGMVFYALSLGSCEAIQQSFFKKREATI